MRRGKVFIYLAFILILGLVAVVVVYQRFLQPATPETTGEVPATPVVDTVNVVVVTQRIPRGSLLNSDVVGVIPIQRDLFIDTMFTDVTQVDGRQAKFDLDSGIPLTGSMLVNDANQLSSTGSLAALSIPRGMVAVSIPVDRLSSVSYAPQPGDHVNVIVSMLTLDLDTDYQTAMPNLTGSVIAPGPMGEGGPITLTASLMADGATFGKSEVDPVLGQTIYSMPSEAQRPRMVTQTLLQDAVVLRMGNFPFEPEKQEPTAPNVEAEEMAAEEQVVYTEDTEQTQPEVLPPDVVTLVVTPQDAVTLNYLVLSGSKLTLALRSADDDSRVQTEAVTLQFLFDQYSIPVPVKLPYGLEPRVDRLESPTLENDLIPTPTP